jgi:hypothetical protein
MTRLSDDDRRTVAREFRELVNMGPRELERRLDSGPSRRVGQKAATGGESTGHRSGRRIIEIKRRRAADRTDADFRRMRKVDGYIRRHLAQRPSGDVTDTRWRASLRNWGHDPLKQRRR